MLSSDKKYLIIFLQTFYIQEHIDFLLQIRLRENIDIVVFSKAY